MIDESAGAELLSRIQTFEPPPEGFDPLQASAVALRRHGFPRRPDPKTEPRLCELWHDAFTQPVTMVRADLAIDHRLTRDALRRGPRDFAPRGWGGAVVLTASLGFNPPEPANVVAGQWQVPEIQALQPAEPPEPLTVGFWVGLDGSTNNQVLQAGTAATISAAGGQVSVDYWPWFEWYPDPAVRITNFPIAPGDIIKVTVCALAPPDHGSATMVNKTKGISTTVGIPAPAGIATVGASAEWIVEGVSDRLPNFVAVTFTDASAGTKNHEFDLSNAVITEITDTDGTDLSEAAIVNPTEVAIGWGDL